MKPILAGFALVFFAVVSASRPATAEVPETAAIADGKWEYRVATKDQILELGKKDLAVGLNKLGEEGWELAGIDGVYIFKRPRDPGRKRAEDLKSLIPLLEADVEMLKDRAAWAERMVKKGFLTARQAEAERLRLKSAELSLQRARRELVPATPKRVEPPQPERKPGL